MSKKTSKTETEIETETETDSIDISGDAMVPRDSRRNAVREFFSTWIEKARENRDMVHTIEAELSAQLGGKVEIGYRCSRLTLSESKKLFIGLYLGEGPTDEKYDRRTHSFVSILHPTEIYNVSGGYEINLQVDQQLLVPDEIAMLVFEGYEILNASTGQKVSRIGIMTMSVEASEDLERAKTTAERYRRAQAKIGA